MKPKVIPKWKSSNGTITPIKNLDINHLKNIITYLSGRGKTPVSEKSRKYRQQWITKLNKELTRRNIT